MSDHASLHLSQASVAKRRKCLEMQGLRLRAPEAYSEYAEEPDGSVTPQIQAVSALQ